MHVYTQTAYAVYPSLTSGSFSLHKAMNSAPNSENCQHFDWFFSTHSERQTTIQFNLFIICWHSSLVVLLALLPSLAYIFLQKNSITFKFKSFTSFYLSLSPSLFGNRICRFFSCWWNKNFSSTSEDDLLREIRKKCRSIHNGITKLNYRTEKIVFREMKSFEGKMAKNEKWRSFELFCSCYFFFCFSTLYEDSS